MISARFGQTRQRVVQRLVAQLPGLLLDHPQRAGTAAGQHLDEPEGHQAHHEPDEEDEPGLDAGGGEPGRRRARDRDRPAPVGLDGDPAGQRRRRWVAAEAGDRRAAERLGERAERGAGAGRDAALRHRGVLALERHRDAALAGDGGAQDRLGVEQADDPAGRAGARAPHVAARRRRGRRARRPRTSRGRGWS